MNTQKTAIVLKAWNKYLFKDEVILEIPIDRNTAYDWFNKSHKDTIHEMASSLNPNGEPKTDVQFWDNGILKLECGVYPRCVEKVKFELLKMRKK